MNHHPVGIERSNGYSSIYLVEMVAFHCYQRVTITMISLEGFVAIVAPTITIQLFIAR